MRVRRALAPFQQAISAFLEDRAATMAAAIGFYTIFSLAPVLVLVIAVAGFAFGEEAARGAIERELRGLLGDEGAQAVEALIRGARDFERGLFATVAGLATLLVASTTVFAQLQDSLNVIWKARPLQVSGLWAAIRTRLLSLSLILGIGFLLLVSLVVNAALAAVSAKIDDLLPGMGTALLVVNFVISFGVVTVLFAMIYKILPDVHLGWRDVWLGAAVTALLFTLGRHLISLYIGNSDIASSYGAAGAFIVVLIWVYYSALIFLFGAELTRAYTVQSRGDPSAEHS